MNIQKLPLDQIRLDGDTQPRVEPNEEVIVEYCERIDSGARFQPLLVYNEGPSYWLVDGFHRHAAALRAGLNQFDCDIREGSLEEAQWASLAVNARHGLRRTNADKRHAIMKALAHPKSAGMSARELAEHIGVHHSTVADYLNEREGAVGNRHDDPDEVKVVIDATNSAPNQKPAKLSPLVIEAPKPAEPPGCEVSSEGDNDADGAEPTHVTASESVPGKSPVAVSEKSVAQSTDNLSEGPNIKKTGPKLILEAQEALGKLAKLVDFLDTVTGNTTDYRACRHHLKAIGDILASWGTKCAAAPDDPFDF